jgi:hypothetical protein
VDEEPDTLGTELHLPPWYEDQRDAILSMLEPIVVPEENRPRPGMTRVRRAAPADAPRNPPITLSRTKAAFRSEKG